MAIVTTIIPVAFNEFGNAGSYCWIKPTILGTYFRFGTHYVPLWIIILLVCVIYICTLIGVLREQLQLFKQSAMDRKMKHISTSMKLYIKLVCN
jgi:uncharacterized membrane protein